MKRAATILLIGYTAMLCGVGLAGIFTSRWELTHVFGLDLAAMTPQIRATFLNQYRFLKAVELGAGLFCWFMRKPILDGGTIGKVFLALVGGGVVARTLAWMVDGRPSWPFIAFLVLEALVFATVLRYFQTKAARVQ